MTQTLLIAAPNGYNEFPEKVLRLSPAEFDELRAIIDKHTRLVDRGGEWAKEVDSELAMFSEIHERFGTEFYFSYRVMVDGAEQ